MTQRKTVLVAGGTGGIGEGIVRVFWESGWEVFVPIRSPGQGENLKAALGNSERLHLLAADLAVPADVTALRNQVTGGGSEVDLVVVSVGSSYYGYSLHKIPRTDWERLVTENLTTHFNLQKEFLDQMHVQNRGTYVTLTGPEADFAHPETGLMSILAAAQKMMARVEALDAAGTGVRIYSVTSANPVATRARGGQSGADWISAQELGWYVQALWEGKAPGSAEACHHLENREQLRRLLRLPPV